MKILGSIEHILGMNMNNNIEQRKVYISQRQYTKDSTKRYTKVNRRAFPTPIDNRQPHIIS